jgi:hypothetical protein
MRFAGSRPPAPCLLQRLIAVGGHRELFGKPDLRRNGLLQPLPGSPEPLRKNLESIKGDERDVIFISVRYGKTSTGYLAMSFGNLNAEGGERRLNVLISRANLRCEVFSSIVLLAFRARSRPPPPARAGGPRWIIHRIWSTDWYLL